MLDQYFSSPIGVGTPRRFTPLGQQLDLGEAYDAVHVPGAIEDGEVVVHQRQTEDRLVGLVARAPDLKDRVASRREVGLPVSLRRASELDVLAVLTL